MFCSCHVKINGKETGLHRFCRQLVAIWSNAWCKLVTLSSQIFIAQILFDVSSLLTKKTVEKESRDEQTCSSP